MSPQANHPAPPPCHSFRLSEVSTPRFPPCLAHGTVVGRPQSPVCDAAAGEQSRPELGSGMGPAGGWGELRTRSRGHRPGSDMWPLLRKQELRGPCHLPARPFAGCWGHSKEADRGDPWPGSHTLGGDGKYIDKQSSQSVFWEAGSAEECEGEGPGDPRSRRQVSSEELHLSQDMSDRREPATQRRG